MSNFKAAEELANQGDEGTNTSNDELKTGYIKVQLDYAPTDSEEAFREWCEKHDFDCFGLNVGRRAWCSSLSTYLRGASGVAYADGEPFLFYEDDVIDIEAYTQQQVLEARIEGAKRYKESLQSEMVGNSDYTVNMHQMDTWFDAWTKATLSNKGESHE